MADDDWYRNETWDAPVREAFFARLKRARSQRDQYIVIQAVTLAERVPEAALELVDHYFETRTDDFDDARALLAQARALQALDRDEEMVAAYKKVLARQGEGPGIMTGAGLDLPFLIAERGIVAEYPLADEMTGGDEPLFPMPRDEFRWHAVRAVLAEHRRDPAAMRDHAAAALEAAAKERSALPGHPQLGLVGAAEQAMRARLQEMTG